VKILVEDSAGLRALEEGYASEAELQTFLRRYPDLMPLEEIELNSPPLLCIGWEVGVLSGAEDILYVDRNGLLSVVETKLRKNPESRREVVGQILEYAAHMSRWSSSDVEQQAERFFASGKSSDEYTNLSLEKALQRFLESDGLSVVSYDDFLRSVQANIDQGHFRLIVAIDEVPESLLRTVEFVNRFSEHFEIYLVQLKRFRDMAREQNIFVPSLFGRVAFDRKNRPSETWDWEKYEAKLGWTERDVQRAEELLGRLEHLAETWGFETRFHQGWIDVRCYGRARFGVQRTRQRGLELFFWLREKPREELPEGVTTRQTKEMLFLAGRLESLGDDQLGRLCEAAVGQSAPGIEVND